MSRWIDADAFLKEYCEPYPHIYKAMSRAMADAPSIDIVRCQDCRHRYMDADLQVWTCTYGLMIKPNGFCNYGEVRDE